VSAVEIWSKAALGAHELVRVTSCGSVSCLCHFLDVLHALRDDMRGNLDVEDEITVLKFDVPDRPAFHELFPSHGIAGAHGRRAHRRPEIWGRRIIRLVREWRGWPLMLVIRVEVSLRVVGMKGPIGLCLPVVVVVMGVVGGGRRGIIWNDKTGWGLVIERIVLLVVSHGFKEGTGSAQQRRWTWLVESDLVFKSLTVITF
jgi:hypothetical protein